ncbi:MAG: protein-disulfide reductase DsbD domain-containing protein [Pseudomonadota bacterium]
MTNIANRRTDRSRAGAVLGLAVALATGGMAPASAAESASPWSETVYTQVRLVSAVTATGTAETVPLGLHFKMEKGWKIYWRAPGDAGFPPKLKWTGSENVRDARLAWPVPGRFFILDVETVGYKDEVVLPLALRPEAPGAALKFAATVDFLTCDQICVPHTVKLALALPAGPAQPSAEAHLVNRFASRVPGDGALQGLVIDHAEARAMRAGTAKTGATVGGSPMGATIRVTATSREPFSTPDVFLDGPAEANFGKPQVTFSDGRRRASLAVPVEGADAGALIGKSISITLADGARMAERTLVVAAGTGPVPSGGGGAPSLAAVLGLALLGGLILNLMPCVLPVLSLKLLGLVGHGGGATRTVRLSFIASAAGILFAFLVLAGALIALKSAGAAIGWGIQFQQPWFLAAMILVTTLFAANLWGFFEVHLPEAISDLGAPRAHVHGLGGHFLGGAFATLLATPCTAPFLGTAIGFALARGAGEIVAVFVALGLGLAAPYLVVAAFPGLATRLPRPGRWMIRLRQVLAVALVATAIWLVSVLVAQVGAASALAAAAGGALLLFLLMVRARRPMHSRPALAAIAVVALATLIAPAWLARAPAFSAPSGGGPWQTFEEARIPEYVAQGKTVFVDVTADWCITCKANKAVVLNQGEVAKRLARAPVVALVADWTRPNDSIGAYLARFGRYGIPFNVVYGPGAPEGITLPELLTSAEVIAALDRAGAAKQGTRAALNR